MESFFGLEPISIMGYVLNVLPQGLKWRMTVLVANFQENNAKSSSTQMLGWYHWKINLTCVNGVLSISKSCI